MITFRLADALPASVVEKMKAELEFKTDAKLRLMVEDYVDAGSGCCALRAPGVARLVEDAFFHFDGIRYKLLAWVIMPNHVHSLIEVHAPFRLRQIVHSWKSFSAKQAHRILRTSGRFWQPDYFDRYIRDEDHFQDCLNYIHENPVRA